ncbi:Uncharacterised protein [Mycobacteroides abscessus subsp. abscessus]|nr:Uncharacterised protein [Mycobacteroides abscessus subsp. abscessus]
MSSEWAPSVPAPARIVTFLLLFSAAAASSMRVSAGMTREG